MKKNKNKSGINFSLLFFFALCLLALNLLFKTIQKKNIVCAPCPMMSFSQLTTFINDASALVANQGEKAFIEFRKKDGKWWSGDSYIFVYDMNGKTLVLPPQPYLEGSNRLSIKDANGIYFVKEMANQLKDRDFGWLQYSYPKPGESIPLPLLANFKKVNLNGKMVLVGSGIYLK